MVYKGQFSPEGAEVDNSIDGLEGLGNELYFFLYLVKSFLLLRILRGFLSSLFFNLLQFLDKFNLLVIVNKFIKVAVVVIHYLNFVCSLVEGINIGPQFLLESLHVGGLIIEVLNGEGVADRVDNFMVFFQLLDGCLVEGPPMEIEDDHDKEGDDISNSDYQIPLAVSIGNIAEAEACEGHTEIFGLSVVTEPSASVLIDEWEDDNNTHNEEGHSQSLDELEVEIDTQSILFQFVVCSTCVQRLVVLATVCSVSKFPSVGLCLKELLCFGIGGQLVTFGDFLVPEPSGAVLQGFVIEGGIGVLLVELQIAGGEQFLVGGGLFESA